MAFHPVRTFLYIWLFMSSVVLLGMTAYRTRYTKSKNHPDILTDRRHFWTPIVVELLSTSILGIIWSLWMILALLLRVGRGPFGTYLAEWIGLFVLFAMYLCGAGIVTHEFSNLKWCRSVSKQCRILEAIKSFSWICWGFTTLLILASLINMLRNRHGLTGPVHGRRDTVGSYPETRTAPVTTTTTAATPVTTATPVPVQTAAA